MTWFQSKRRTVEASVATLDPTRKRLGSLPYVVREADGSERKVAREAFLRDYVPVAGPQTPIERIWTARDVADAIGHQYAASGWLESAAQDDFDAALKQNERRMAHEQQVFNLYGDDTGEIRFLDMMGNDTAIVAAGRTSYGKEMAEITEELCDKLLTTFLRDAHGAPFESTALKFRAVIPLFPLQEHLRHRIGWGYSQESARYRKLEFKIYLPRVWRGQHATNKQMSAATDLPQAHLTEISLKQAEAAFAHYQWLLDQGVARELARIFLPHGTYTKVITTCNMRSLLHFLGLRLAPAAQWEIRRIAEGYLHFAEPFFPRTFAKWRELGYDQGFNADLVKKFYEENDWEVAA